MAFTNVWDVTYPPDSQLANLLGQDLRNLRLDIQQRMGAISGLDAAKPAFGTDTQPANWNGVLYFATDTGKVYQWNTPVWTDVSPNLLNSPVLWSSQWIPLSGTAFMTIGTTGTQSASEANAKSAMPSPGLMKNLYITTQNVQGVGGTCVFTFRKNGASQSLSVSIAANAAAGVYTDVVNSFTFAAGDLLDLMVLQAAGASLQVTSVMVQICTP